MHFPSLVGWILRYATRTYVRIKCEPNARKMFVRIWSNEKRCAGHTNPREIRRQREVILYRTHTNYNICGMWPTINCYAQLQGIQITHTHSHSSLDMEHRCPTSNLHGIYIESTWPVYTFFAGCVTVLLHIFVGLAVTSCRGDSQLQQLCNKRKTRKNIERNAKRVCKPSLDDWNCVLCVR